MKTRKEYYEENKEKIKEQMRIYYALNREKILAKHKEWRDNNKGWNKASYEKVKAIEKEKRDLFNSLSQDEQIAEMLLFVKDKMNEKLDI